MNNFDKLWTGLTVFDEFLLSGVFHRGSFLFLFGECKYLEFASRSVSLKIISEVCVLNGVILDYYVIQVGQIVVGKWFTELTLKYMGLLIRNFVLFHHQHCVKFMQKYRSKFLWSNHRWLFQLRWGYQLCYPLVGCHFLHLFGCFLVAGLLLVHWAVMCYHLKQRITKIML